MYENEGENNEIFSKALRAGRRTYFFDIRGTKAGDYYLTITESKKFTHEDGSSHYQKHKIYLYKEDFNAFREILDEMTSYVFEEKGEEVISEKHQRTSMQKEEKRTMVLHHLLLMISKILSNSIFPKRKEATLFGQPLFLYKFLSLLQAAFRFSLS